MQNFKLAVAQIPSKKGNIEENIQNHIQVIEYAGTNNVSLIVFPELSLSGYEPELSESLAITTDDVRLNKLSVVAVENAIWIIVGAPLRNKQNIEVGAIIISPAGEITTYSKMKLHPGENEYFKAGEKYKILDIQNQKVAVAICADTTHPEHANNYAEMGASVYVAGVLISSAGYKTDTELLSSYAKEHNMLVRHKYPIVFSRGNGEYDGKLI